MLTPRKAGPQACDVPPARRHVRLIRRREVSARWLHSGLPCAGFHTAGGSEKQFLPANGAHVGARDGVMSCAHPAGSQPFEPSGASLLFILLETRAQIVYNDRLNTGLARARMRTSICTMIGC